MWPFNKKEEIIDYSTLKLGMILKVYPASRSHESQPYFVEVIESHPQSFKTRLAKQSIGKTIYNHEMEFVYKSDSWEYHYGRFKIMK